MTQQFSGYLRILSWGAVAVAFIATIYVWSQPPDVSHNAYFILSIVSITALLFESCVSFLSRREMARLSDDLDRKSEQVLELLAGEKKDDEIVDSLRKEINRLIGILSRPPADHLPGKQEGSPLDLAPQEEVAHVIVPEDLRTLDHPRLLTPQEFRLLAAQSARVAGRYGRYFTVIRIRMGLKERSRQVGELQAQEECRVALDKIAQALRKSDFACSEHSDLLIIGFPETSAVHVGAIISRLRAVLAFSSARDLTVEIDSRGLGSIRP